MILYFFIFLFGLAVGSFLNVLIDRLPKDEKISGRSYCDHCKKQLLWYDLIPVFSFFLLRGKCRYCHQKISWQYPIVEFLTGILFVFIFRNLNFGFILNFEFWPIWLVEPTARIEILDLVNLVYLWAIVSFLIVIFFADLKYYIIPDKIIYPAIVVALFYQVFRILDFEFILDFAPSFDGAAGRMTGWNLEFGILGPILSAILASGFFFILVLVSRGKWMGMGDIKLAFFMGLLLGWPNILVALFLAYILGAIIGIGLILAGKKKLKSEIPFGPFLVLGTLTALFWGQKIIGWYSSLIMHQ